jgi:hypothetical protein
MVDLNVPGINHWVVDPTDQRTATANRHGLRSIGPMNASKVPKQGRGRLLRSI